MSSGSSSILTSFTGALQASVAVLLTVCSGAIAAQFRLLSESSAKDISKTCVRLFLPALLIHNVGSQLHLDTGIKYLPILIYSIAYNTLSMAAGIAMVRVFKQPGWVAPALAFNNTTSLPLLLVQSLEATGILASLDPSEGVVDRAKSYFLVNAMVSNSLTFALGPRMLNGQEEDAPDGGKGKSNEDEDEEDGAAEEDSEDNDEQDDNDDDNDRPTEETSLLPSALVRRGQRAASKTRARAQHHLSKLPPWARSTLDIMYQFLNAPLIGAVIGAIIGLTPALHRLFFSSPQEGGYFKAWLTAAIKNVGDLFAALQVVVVGVKLSAALVKMKQGREAGEVPWRPFAAVTAVRFVLWPLVSIPLIWVLATKTGWLGKDDPILWFAMMLMPAGPPAMKLTALADVNGSGEQEKMSIAKFLTLSYLVSPLICFSVVGSLKASEAAVSMRQ
ncbi:uncharacterized protein K452DRAFT_264565 [Aplosporella prunicola CBS 121167]|uniref:Auxin efflux carrier n=1 Tax=Aplosporella prunicola CBS 121167 TaxID=1176127 RepID=A0A6A6BPX3_9PEZI|nr:uncharacterized protein K452DRAFT_264565 [Aplosporella prunicola CBS 121167]KAF2145493.1 hypothetical protein K452DRAFT_264565 [Aplosporella prunicola CBS 121167]